MFRAPKLGRFRSLASLILVVNVVGELQRKRTLAAARLSCIIVISAGCSLSVDPNTMDLLQRESEILAGIGECAEKVNFGVQKALITLKRGTIGPRLLLRKSLGSHLCAQQSRWTYIAAFQRY